MPFLRLCLCALVVGGCAREVARPEPRPAFNVYSDYEEPIAGAYALVTDPQMLTGRFEIIAGKCAGEAYAADIGNAFTATLHRTLQPLFDFLEVPDRAVTASDLERGELSGVIFARVQEFDIDLVAVEALFDAQLAAEVGITASVIVDDLAGRALGTTVSTEGEAVASTGSFCGGGTAAIEEAAAEALQDLARQIGERIANSPRIRVGASPAGSRPGPALQPEPPVGRDADTSEPGELWIDRGRGLRERVY